MDAKNLIHYTCLIMNLHGARRFNLGSPCIVFRSLNLGSPCVLSRSSEDAHDDQELWTWTPAARRNSRPLSWISVGFPPVGISLTLFHSATAHAHTHPRSVERDSRRHPMAARPGRGSRLEFVQLLRRIRRCPFIHRRPKARPLQPRAPGGSRRQGPPSWRRAVCVGESR